MYDAFAFFALFLSLVSGEALMKKKRGNKQASQKRSQCSVLCVLLVFPLIFFLPRDSFCLSAQFSERACIFSYNLKNEFTCLVSLSLSTTYQLENGMREKESTEFQTMRKKKRNASILVFSVVAVDHIHISASFCTRLRA